METAFTPLASLGASYGGGCTSGHGIGWGIAGFCPGGALPAVGTGDPTLLPFLAALICGQLIARTAQSRGLARKPT
jgi:uncharacterized membrane protein YedE/YeeE